MAADRALGQAMARQLLAEEVPWSGERTNEYVNRLGQNLARSSGSPQPMAFHVLYSHKINAQTLPGGFVFINSAVIAAAESEDELAAVLAHEIAHVNHCDWHRRERKKKVFTGLLAALPLGLVAGPAGVAVGFGMAVSTPFADARMSRTREQEADRAAVQYLIAAGYDPRAALTMLERLQAQGAEQWFVPSGLLASHPSVNARRHKLEKLLAGLPARPARADDSAEFKEIRAAILRHDEIDVLPLGSAPSDEDPPKLQRRPAGTPP